MEESDLGYYPGIYWEGPREIMKLLMIASEHEPGTSETRKSTNYWPQTSVCQMSLFF
jgi:hypothetical protein